MIPLSERGAALGEIDYFERPTPTRLHRRETPRAVELDSRIPKTIQSLDDLTACFKHIVDNDISIKLNENHTISPRTSSLLNHALQRAESDSVKKHVDKISIKLGKSGWGWFLGNRLRGIDSEGKRFKKKELYTLGSLLCEKLPLAARTTKSREHKKPTDNEMLTYKMLDEACDEVVLCDFPNSIVSQLGNPLGYALNGLIVRPRPGLADQSFNYDHTLPSRMYDILKTLRYPESEKVLRDWVLNLCQQNGSTGEGVLLFLTTLTNFTPLLGRDTQTSMWGVELEEPRAEEIYTQPFLALTGVISFTYRELYRTSPTHPFINRLKSIESLVRVRFNEVYRGHHQRSLTTTSAGALIPTPHDFAEFMYSVLPYSEADADTKARALVRFAEVSGIEDIFPLIKRLEGEIAVQRAFTTEARRAGLIDSPRPLNEVWAQLKRDPWRDAADIPATELIDMGTTVVELYAFTGTFGPFHRGHKRPITMAQNYLDLLPQRDERGRIVQRFILVLPLLDVSKIENYDKSPEDVGLIDKRLNIMFRQLSSAEIDRKKVLVTTSLQPELYVPKSVVENTTDTCTAILRKWHEELRKAHRFAGLQLKIKFINGSDELMWVEDKGNRKLAPKSMQKEKLSDFEGIVVVRAGDQLAVLNSLKDFADQTALEAILFNPGASFSSSSVKEDISRKGTTNQVEPAAKQEVEDYWSPRARLSRIGIEGLTHIPNATKACEELVEELGEQIGDSNRELVAASPQRN